MDAKRWIVFVVIVVAVVGGMVYMSMQNKLDVDDFTDEKIAKILPAEARSGDIADHVKGNAKSKVVFVEYGDFQCGPCRSAHETLKPILAKYNEQIAFVFRNFPITQMHPNSRAASAAAEAAGLQGKFWEMFELLFDNQSGWESAKASERTDIFIDYAKQLNLDIDKFKSDIASEKITKKIDLNVALGRKQGVNGTPSFFINGKSVDLSGGSTAIEDAIKDALKKEGVKIPED